MLKRLTKIFEFSLRTSLTLTQHMARTTTIGPLPDSVFYPLWQATFRTQLWRLYQHLGKAVELEDEGTRLSHDRGDDFGDFCQYVYLNQPELIDEQQN